MKRLLSAITKWWSGNPGVRHSRPDDLVVFVNISQEYHWTAKAAHKTVDFVRANAWNVSFLLIGLAGLLLAWLALK